MSHALLALRTVTELDTHGMLDNTYIIHTSDNGYHFGSFRLGGGKARPIEEDIHVPFYIRGPGVPAGEVLPYQGSMIDVAPTLLALAGGYGRCMCLNPVAVITHLTEPTGCDMAYVASAVLGSWPIG